MSPLTLRVPGKVIAGHGVASGAGLGCRYPEGSLGLQIPLFLERGLDLRAFHRGTVNVSTAPQQVAFENPPFAFRGVRWTEHHPAEDFSFVRCRLVHGGEPHAGWAYRPDPRTKAEHFQAPDVVEVVTNRIDALEPGDAVVLELDPREVGVTTAPAR